MHRTAFARTQWRAGTRRARTCRTRALKDRLARDRTSRRRAVHRRSACRGQVNRPRPGLRSDHATRRRLCDLNLLRGSRWSWLLLTGLDVSRRLWRRCRRLRGSRRNGIIRARSGVRQNRARRSCRSRRRCWRRCRRRRLHDHGRLGGARRGSGRRLRRRGGLGRSRRRLGGLLADRAQYVAGLRDLGKIDLGLDAAGLSRRRRRLRFRLIVTAAGEVLAHPLGNIGIERAGVALLIVDADGRQIVYDRFALDLELARQIVDADFFQCSFQFPVSSSRQYRVPTTNLLFALVRLFAVHVDFRRICFARRRRVLFPRHRIGFERLTGVGEVAHAVFRIGRGL